jgi:hypothetical protein
MADPEPDAEVTYRVVPTGGTFAVEVTVPGNLPAMVIGMASQQAAEAWIADLKVRAAANSRLAGVGRSDEENRTNEFR